MKLRALLQGFRSIVSARSGSGIPRFIFPGAADSLWPKIGVGFIRKDGKDFDIVLDALPISGHVVLRLGTPKPKAE